MKYIGECKTYCIVTFIIIIILLVFIPAFLIKKNGLQKIILYYYIIIIIILFIILFTIPIKDKQIWNHIPSKNVIKEPLGKIKDGVSIKGGINSSIHKIKNNNDFIFKKYKNKPKKIINILPQNSRCIVDSLINKFFLIGEWNSVQLNKKYYGLIDSIPLLRNIDHNNLTYWQEFCTHATKNDIPLIKKQFKKINDQLKKYDLFYTDIHIDNVMFNKNKQIKFIDGDLKTKNQFKWYKFQGSVTYIMSRITKRTTRPPSIDIYNKGKIIKSGYV